MKKVLALLLALVMVFSLVACGGGDDSKTSDNGGNTDVQTPADNGGDDANTPGDDDNGGAPAVTVATPNANEDGTPNLDRIAYYDPNYDYSQNEQFSFSYHAFDAGVLYQQSAYAYEHWCKIFNLKWDGFVAANDDSDMFMTNLQTYLDQGTQSFVLDPDLTTYPAIYDLLSNYPDVKWMSQMGCPRDDGFMGEMLNNFVGFDYKDMGVQSTDKLIEWLNATHPGVDIKSGEVGFLTLTLEASPALHDRVVGAHERWIELGGSEDNYYEVDTASYGLTLQGGIDASSPVLSTNTQYKYWLIFGLIDDLAQGAASVITTMGLTDNACVACVGGPGLQVQFDGGQFDSFRYAYFTPNLAYAEPILGCIYAELNGWATAETIWPSWVKASDHGGDGHTYSQLYLPSYWIDKDNYQEIMEWSDTYSGANFYNYDVTVTADAFSSQVDPADAPAGWLD